MSSLPVTPDDPAASPPDQLADLRRRLRTYQERYGVQPSAALHRLEQAAARRSAEIRRLRSRAAALESEAAVLEQELAGYRKGLVLLLGDALRDMGERYGEGWSPTPVLGYRLWAVRAGGFFGVAARWRSPRLEARCLDGMGDAEVPHSDRRCGRLGCGIYAAKDLRRLLVERPGVGTGALAVGVVELTGKVVEHERGYRAAFATVVALAVVAPEELVLTDDPSRIATLFGHAAAHMDLSQPARHPDPGELAQLEAFLDIERRRDWSWT